MTDFIKVKEHLLQEAEKLHQRYLLSQTISPDFYEPGMMEYLDQSDGIYSAQDKNLFLKFEVKGTRYEGRTEEIERIQIGEPVQWIREKENPFNPNNFTIVSPKGHNLGNMPAELCNAIAPLYDAGMLTCTDSYISYAEPISQRSRHAKQAILFVALQLKLQC